MWHVNTILTAGLITTLPGHVLAATFYVSPAGVDTNSGTETLPWRTLQKAANVAQAGDVVMVHAGNYSERVTTARGGAAEENRITFRASGVATVQGFSINHPYVTVDGFDITGHSAPSKLTGYIEVRSNGDFARILNNTVRDGVALIRNDFVFSHNTPAPNTISSASGGFLAAGFRAGMTVSFSQTERDFPVVNAGATVVIDSLTDNILTLSTAFNPFNKDILNDSPGTAYVTGSANYGIIVNQGANNVMVRGNRFSNLSYDVAWIGGDSTLFEQNELRQCNGFNGIVYSGQNNTFRRNWVHSSPATVYIVSPDAMENWSPIAAIGTLFEENFVMDFEGPLGVHHLQALGGNTGLTFRSNVFINAGSFVIGFPNTSFINNTFYSVSRVAMKSATPELHPITFLNSSGRFSSEGAVVKNNIFVACGDATKNVNLRGWYNLGGTLSFAADYNFVAAEAPAFGPKTGFSEGRANLNGGDPGFVDINDPLGLDGLPFTGDDGLRLTPFSKLGGTGDGGIDLGAYMTPRLNLTLRPNGQLRIAWPSTMGGYTLQKSTDLTVWEPFTGDPVVEGLFKVVDVGTATTPSAFFRLAK